MNGTLVTADGIVVVAGHVFRFASREDMHEVSLKDGRLVVVWGPERKHWCLYSEVPGSDANAELEKRRNALSTWLTSGTMPAPDVEGQPHKPPPRLLSTCVKLVAGSAGMQPCSGSWPACPLTWCTGSTCLTYRTMYSVVSRPTASSNGRATWR